MGTIERYIGSIRRYRFSSLGIDELASFRFCVGKKLIMSPEILLVRHGDGYCVLHGHLHLVNLMNESEEALVDASGEGKVKVVKTAEGILVGEENERLPLLINGD
jgi:hypothetical protein